MKIENNCCSFTTSLHVQETREMNKIKTFIKLGWITAGSDTFKNYRIFVRNQGSLKC